jgi:hypothetical protein
VGALAGLDLPLMPTEHQYLITETIPEIAALSRRLPSVSDRDGEYYRRQEGPSLLVSAYERDMCFWAEDGTLQNSDHELFTNDLGCKKENISCAVACVLALGEVGVKRIINCPMILVAGLGRSVRPRARTRELFLLRRHHPRLLTVRWAEEPRCQVDGGGRALDRHVCLSSRLLRPLGRQAFQLKDPFSLRGAAGGPSCVHPSCLADVARAGRCAWLELWLGAPALVRGKRRAAQGNGELHTLELVSTCGLRGADSQAAWLARRQLELAYRARLAAPA